ncbi:hypothetical protein OKHIL_01890 [Mycolicibacterium mageritense]
MEPNGRGGRPNRMPVDTLLADTATIRTLGSAYATHAADLTVVATTLGAVPAPQLGPVGARFLTAFASAVAAHSAAVTALGAGSAHAGAVARDNADAYDAAGHRARRMLPQV